MFFILIFAASSIAAAAAADFPGEPYYARINTFGAFAGYSNDSSHILVGLSEGRKLLNFGFFYGRRLHVGNLVDWQYEIEVMPVALESDPLGRIVVQQSTPDPQTYSYISDPPISCATQTQEYTGFSSNGSDYSGTETIGCAGRRWTMGEAISPLGMEWNFLTRMRTQPFFDAHAGSMFSTHIIPIPGAASKNFTFSGGIGIERFLSPGRSVRIEYRIHHISNAGTASLNPGIDNGMLRVGFCFGR